MSTAKFDPTQYLTKIKGQDYLEAKYRLMWLESEETFYTIDSKLISFLDGRAIVESTVSIRDIETGDDGAITRSFVSRSATGIGSETTDSFEAAIEKAQTKSISRALGMLGFGTQFAVEFMEPDAERNMSSLADAPVGQRQQQPQRQQQQRTHARDSRNVPNGARNQTGGDEATNAQKSMIQYKARQAQMEPQQLVEFIQETVGKSFNELTKREASQVIDAFNG